MKQAVAKKMLERLTNKHNAWQRWHENISYRLTRQVVYVFFLKTYEPLHDATQLGLARDRWS